MDNTIVDIQSRLFRIPLPEVLSNAKHGDPIHFELVTVTANLKDGSSGTGYTYTGGKGEAAIKVMIDHDLAPYLLGKNGAKIAEIYDYLK